MHFGGKRSVGRSSTLYSIAALLVCCPPVGGGGEEGKWGKRDAGGGHPPVLLLKCWIWYLHIASCAVHDRGHMLLLSAALLYLPAVLSNLLLLHSQFIGGPEIHSFSQQKREGRMRLVDIATHPPRGPHRHPLAAHTQRCLIQLTRRPQFSCLSLSLSLSLSLFYRLPTFYLLHLLPF